MSSHTKQSDKRLGMTILLGVSALAGGAAMMVGHGSATAGYGFAVAMVAGALLIGILHTQE